MICHPHRSPHSTSQYYSTTAGTPLPAHQHWPHTVHTQCTVLVGWEYLHYSQPSTSYSSSPLAVCCRVVSYGRFTAFSCNGTITLYNADREVCWKQEYDFFDGRQVLSHCALTQGCWVAGLLGVSTLFRLSGCATVCCQCCQLPQRPQYFGSYIDGVA